MNELGEPLLPTTASDTYTELPKESVVVNRGTSSFLQATFNNVGVLVGLGMLSCPYALQRGGWIGLFLLVSCGFIFCYSAYVLGLCCKPGSSTTYQQVGEVAFGVKFRAVSTVFIYLELLGALVGFTISLSNNLVKIFPHATLSFHGIQVPPAELLPIVAVAVVLPIICLRNLSWVSYVSLTGIAAYLFIVLAVLWTGIVDHLGFHHKLNVVNAGSLAEVTGLYLFCYSGHLIIPRIYSSMKSPSQYPQVAMVSFSVSTLIYLTVGIAGATMFGDKIQSQVTLNLPTELVVSKLALWIVILIPLTKYALNVNPIAVELESLASWKDQSSAVRNIISICIRTSVMVVVLTLALTVPSFETTIALIGSTISTTNCVILPCIFHMKIFRQSISRKQVALDCAVALAGIVLATTGTIASVRKL